MPDAVLINLFLHAIELKIVFRHEDNDEILETIKGWFCWCLRVVYCQ